MVGGTPDREESETSEERYGERVKATFGEIFAMKGENGTRTGGYMKIIFFLI